MKLRSLSIQQKRLKGFNYRGLQGFARVYKGLQGCTGELICIIMGYQDDYMAGRLYGGLP